MQCSSTLPTYIINVILCSTFVLQKKISIWCGNCVWKKLLMKSKLQFNFTFILQQLIGQWFYSLYLWCRNNSWSLQHAAFLFRIPDYGSVLKFQDKDNSGIQLSPSAWSLQIPASNPRKISFLINQCVFLFLNDFCPRHKMFNLFVHWVDPCFLVYAHPTSDNNWYK